MKSDNRSAGGWRRAIALSVAGCLLLGALVALRGPDTLGTAPTEIAGGWKLSGPSLWAPLAPLGAFIQATFSLAGPRGWQNTHVAVIWFALFLWLLAVPAKSWRGLFPLLPALLAVTLSSPQVGLTGFGVAVLVVSLWSALRIHHKAYLTLLGTTGATWLAVWLSPGALPLVVAALASVTSHLSRIQFLGGAALAAVAASLTPRGWTVWSEAWIFFRWSPQPPLGTAAVVALLASLIMLGIAASASRKSGNVGIALAPALLFAAASFGQTAYLWAGALWMIPCWTIGREHLRETGFHFRWWINTTALAAASVLLLGPILTAWPQWYSLAMNRAVAQPTLTRQSLPPDVLTYINPQGLAMARFPGPLPPRSPVAELPQLAREPRLWREQDRRVRYGAVWLLGDKSDYAPLARHLGQSPDWRLEAADATGLMFIRAPREEIFRTEPAKDLANEDMWGGANRSAFLSAAALASLAGYALPEAGELAKSAVRHAERSAPAAAARARILMALGEVREAVEESNRAMKLDPSSAEVWLVRIEALLRAGKIDDAYAAAQGAVELNPGNTGTLWLATKTASAAHAYQRESALLERLIDLTHGRGGDTGFYQLYLGQSYARQGLARPALRALEKALKTPGLSEVQQAELEEELRRIRSAAGGG